MIRTLEVSDEAQGDILGIVEWLDERSQQAGDLFYLDAQDCFTRLLRFPNSGRPYKPRRKTRGPFRYHRVSVRFHDYLVFYEVHRRSVRVVALVHGARDLQAFLRDR